MSASSKKKLRKEQETAKLTEKQVTASKEAKKLNLYTAIFIAVMVIMLVVAITVGVRQTIRSSGILAKNTTAMTVGGEKVSNAQLNYYYVEAVNNFMQQFGGYASMLGIDLSKPLDEQVADGETGLTWADSFLDSAKENAKAVYAVANEAKAQGFTLSEAELADIEGTISNLDVYAMMSGFPSGEDYLKGMYGNSATLETFREYLELGTLSNAYLQHHADSLTYDAAALEAKDQENTQVYNSYSYNTYYLAASRFLEGGTADAEGQVTYSDAETAASVTAAEETAKALTAEGTTTVEDLDAAIAALEINSESTTAASTGHEDVRYNAISSNYADWITDTSRKEGDVAYFANATASTDENGNEVTTTNGYNVVVFLGVQDNRFPLKNVRHILVSYQGGTTDPNTGMTVYTEEEKAAAKAEADAILKQWESGDANEESFAALATEKSTDPGSAANGGLYENVYPGQMVAAFGDWCFDEGRKVGDTGIVETEYGYHVMFFSGDSDTDYRSHLIETDLRTAEQEAWYNGLLENVSYEEGSTKYIDTGLVLNAG